MKIYGKKESYNFVKPMPWKWLVHHFVDNFADYHLPPFDVDDDGFSDISTFRGYHWRGADCNEF
jgi:acyloxyacyl hydrolase